MIDIIKQQAAVYRNQAKAIDDKMLMVKQQFILNRFDDILKMNELGQHPIVSALKMIEFGLFINRLLKKKPKEIKEPEYPSGGYTSPRTYSPFHQPGEFVFTPKAGKRAFEHVHRMGDESESILELKRELKNTILKKSNYGRI